MSEISVLLFTEDSSKWALETLEELSRRIFDWVTPQVDFGPWLSFESVNDAALTGAQLMSSNPRDRPKILRLCRALASQVLRKDGFVLFHRDGDVIWGEDCSPNVSHFDAVIRKMVRDIVRGKLLEVYGADTIETRLDARMSKLILLAPCYSIETWLFANVARLRQFGAHEAILDEWERDLSTLDRAKNPKRLASVSTRYYPELGRELKTNALYELNTSFAEAVHAVGACGSLVVRLRRQWPSWVRAQYGLSTD